VSSRVMYHIASGCEFWSSRFVTCIVPLLRTGNPRATT